MAGSSSLTPAQRALRARLAAHVSWARTSDRSARTAPARLASLARFEALVDPDGVLSAGERAARAESARRAYFVGLALRSSRVRAGRAGHRGGGGGAR